MLDGGGALLEGASLVADVEGLLVAVVEAFGFPEACGSFPPESLPPRFRTASAARPPMSSSATTRPATRRGPRLLRWSPYVVVVLAGGTGGSCRSVGGRTGTPSAGMAAVRPARSRATVAAVLAAAAGLWSAAARVSRSRVLRMPARRAGSLTSNPATASSSAPPPDIGGTGSEMTAVRVPRALSESNGGRPSAAAYSVAPSDHRSLSGPNAFPLARSGDMYEGEPRTTPVEVRAGSPAVEAMPKSVRTPRPSLVTSTLLGFTSRCTTPCAWADSRALSTSRPISATRCGGSGPSSRRSSLRLRVGSSSITIQGRPPSSTTS